MKVKFNLPPIFFKLTRTPKYQYRSKNILFCLNYLYENFKRGYNRFDQIAEFGVASGEGFRRLNILICHFCKLNGVDIPEVYGFDTFTGMPETKHQADKGYWEEGDYKGNLEELQNFITEMEWSNCKLVKGLFGDSLKTVGADFKPSFLIIDCDYYTSTLDVFEFLKGRIDSGTVVYFDDLGFNFFNKNLGEERLIHEVNEGKLGNQYYLHQIWDRSYVWSNSDKPVLKENNEKLALPLIKDVSLTDFF